MYGEIGQPSKHVDKAWVHTLTFTAPEQYVSVEQVQNLQDALAVVQREQPATLEDYALYSEVERRRLAVRLGVRGTHATVQCAAGVYSELISSVGVAPRHGRHEWQIDH
jgi:hypothetical protein